MQKVNVLLYGFHKNDHNYLKSVLRKILSAACVIQCVSEAARGYPNGAYIRRKGIVVESSFIFGVRSGVHCNFNNYLVKATTNQWLS